MSYSLDNTLFLIFPYIIYEMLHSDVNDQWPAISGKFASENVNLAA